MASHKRHKRQQANKQRDKIDKMIAYNVSKGYPSSALPSWAMKRTTTKVKR